MHAAVQTIIDAGVPMLLVRGQVSDLVTQDRAEAFLARFPAVDFVDVGQGDAILVTSPAGKTVLIDGGPHQAGPRLAAFVRGRLRRGAPIDLVLLTHRHADHLGGLAAVIEAQGARMFMDAPAAHASPAPAAPTSSPP